MNTLKSKFSLLTALLCLALMAQGQVTNPYNSSFEIDLTGTADPQLVLKREVTTGGGGPTGGSGGTATITYNYHWNLDAGSGGLEFNSMSPTGTETNALRLNSSSAYFNGNLLSVGNSLSADASGLTVMGNNFSVGTSLNVDGLGVTVNGDLFSVGNSLSADASGLAVSGSDFSVGSKFRVDDIATRITNELVVLNKNITVGTSPDPTDPNQTTNELRITPNGVMTARRVEVNTDYIPDYVFEPDYDLMSIKELKAYIAKHGHLPNIKSAEEYEAIGTVDLGELNIKLLEKVEELSLYTIELKEETTTLKEELKAMRAELDALKAAK